MFVKFSQYPNEEGYRIFVSSFIIRLVISVFIHLTKTKYGLLLFPK